MKNVFLPLVCMVSIFVASCSQEKVKEMQKDELALHIDSSIPPGSDFFSFANGSWFKANPIPETEGSNGIWTLIRDTINAQLRNICESSSLGTFEKGSNKQKIGDFYFSGMDSAAVEKAGISVLAPELEMIQNIKNPESFARATARIHLTAGSPVFGFYVGQDDRISDKHAVFFWQGGLGLPDRDYYFDKDERTTMIRNKYIAFLKNMLSLTGSDSLVSGKLADEVFSLEVALATVSRKMEDLREPEKNYHKMNFGSFNKSNPGFDWRTFLAEVGIQSADTVIVGQPEFFEALNKTIGKHSMDTWKNYLRLHLVRGLAGQLDAKIYAENFAFYSTTLRGVPTPKPRWKRVVEETNGSLGELMGQIYVDEYLPKGTKEKLVEIGQAIKTVYAGRIKQLAWMSEPTKEKALGKLNTMVFKVGYPDKWKDMSTLQIERGSYARNAMAANEWQMRFMTGKYGKSVDRTEWSMYPQTYNAYYNPSNNEIVVPGCNIIVPGYERTLADDALLYSIIGGSTFGHEITHGFDDQGCQYDEKGNLSNWWTPEDSTKFFALTGKIVNQFNGYLVVDSLFINGDATQGENIADLGGVIMGFEAFKLTEQFKNQEKISGMTPEQRYFCGYALAWMVNTRPESLANQVKTDVHSPAKYRVVGPLSNMPEFYAAFGVKEGDAMWRPEGDRVIIW